jgi:hypothetical protein
VLIRTRITTCAKSLIFCNSARMRTRVLCNCDLELPAKNLRIQALGKGAPECALACAVLTS